MNTKQIRKLLACSITILGALSALTAPDKAQAYTMQAYLQNCSTQTSVTGRMIYVGTYAAGGNTYTFSFASYCPSVVNLQ